jgi:DNA-directed RNA polymerase subunit RPC12/RpoP
MSVLQQFKCPCCDGAIEFDSTVQKMKCPYCGTEFDMEAIQPQEEHADEMTWDTAAGSEWQPGETEGLRIYTCNTCGGEIVADDTAGATECPYCGNPVVMTGQFAGDLKPDLVIPFKLDKKAAIAKLQELYKGKKLLPRVFKDQNHIREVKGLYVPVWLFDTDADAHVRYKASTVRTWSDSDYNYTETSYFSVTRGGSIGFADVPVDGSTKMDDTLMESIEPYDLSAAVDFQTAYLSGYLADKYDVDAEESVQRANERIRRSTEEAFAATVQGYATVTPTASSIRLNNGRARYALLPVWILNTQWNGQKFTFAINGQTGKIVGDLPVDQGAYNKWLFGVAGAVSAAVFALSYLLWLL